MTTEDTFFDGVKSDLEGKQTRILLPEYDDERVREAAKQLVDVRGVDAVLLVQEGTKTGLPSHEIRKDEELIQVLLRKRRAKGMTRREAEAKVLDPVMHAMLLVEAGRADGVVCGASHPTADTYRPALRIIGPEPGETTVSTSFIMFWEDKTMFFADCALNRTPSTEDLVSIATGTARTAQYFGYEPKVAMLSFSTTGSADGASVRRVRRATKQLRNQHPELAVLGEAQFDAAFLADVQAKKAPSADVKAPCNCYVFPDLNAGNIGYKIAQRLGGASAIGPVTQGLKKPVNDVSRGCSVKDFVETVLITAHQAHHHVRSS